MGLLYIPSNLLALFQDQIPLPVSLTLTISCSSSFLSPFFICALMDIAPTLVNLIALSNRLCITWLILPLSASTKMSWG